MTKNFTIILRTSIAASIAGAAALSAAPALAEQPAETASPERAVTSNLGAPDSGDTEERESNPSDIVVTGTLIRGIEPAGAAIIGVSQEQIAALGANNTNDVLKRIPQINTFLGLEQPLAAAQFQQVNQPTLRNLNTTIVSSNSTLLLLDGHRMVNSGVTQNSPDPDIVPPGAIERVEVLPDGGSATYGTDAVGGVINFITRKRYDGVKVNARYGFTNKYWTIDADVIAGKDWGSGSAYVSYAYSKTDDAFGKDRDWVRKFGPNNAPNPDRACDPGNVTITRTGVPTTYAMPGLVPGTFNGCDLSDDQTVLPRTERHSVMASFVQDLTDSLTFEARGYYTKRETLYFNTLNSTGSIGVANPYYRRTADNPAPQAALTQSVQFSWAPVLGRDTAISSGTVLKSWGVTPTLVWKAGEWQVRAMANLGWSDSLAYDDRINGTELSRALAGTTTATALNPYDLKATDPAVLAKITNFGAYAQGRQSMRNFRVIADGPLFTLPGGEVHLAVGAEYLRETYRAKLQNLASARTAGPKLPFKPGAKRDNKSVFGELAVPVVGEGNRFGGVYALDLSVSGRYDEYSDFGGTFNPKFAVTYKPVDWVKIRGNWGKSFNAPALADSPQAAVDARILQVTAALLANPLPGQYNPAIQAQWPMLVIQGGVEGTQPQKATTWEVGADIDPPFLPGLKLSATYYSVDFKNTIGAPPAAQLLNLYTNYKDFYIMLPTDAQVLAAAALAPGGLDVVTPLLAPGALDIYAILDSRRRNLGRVKAAGLDFSANYITQTGFGSIDLSVAGNYELKRKNQPVKGTPFIDTLKVDLGKWRAQASAGANIGNLRAQATLYHRHGYKLTPTAANNQQAYANSFNVVDLYFRYDLSDTATILKDSSISLSINNMFDQDPPLYRGTSNTTQGHGHINGFTVGRMFQIGVSKKF